MKHFTRITILFAALSAIQCGTTNLFDEALTNYPRIVRSGLNEWYPLNGNLTSRVGSAAGSAAGAYSGGTNRVGESNKAVCVSAASLSFTNTTIAANPFTISAWVKFNAAPGGTNIIFEKGVGCTSYNGIRIQQNTTTALDFDHGSCGGAPGFLSTNMVAANTWIYFAFSYGNGTGNFYLGTYGGSFVNVGTTTPAKDYAQYSTAFQIFPGANVNACIDDFLNYSRVLSTDEVKQNFLSLE